MINKITVEDEHYCSICCMDTEFDEVGNCQVCGNHKDISDETNDLQEKMFLVFISDKYGEHKNTVERETSLVGRINGALFTSGASFEALYEEDCETLCCEAMELDSIGSNVYKEFIDSSWITITLYKVPNEPRI